MNRLDEMLVSKDAARCGHKISVREGQMDASEQFTSSMTIAREEIFGPVLSIILYEDETDAIRISNDTPMDCPGS